MSEWMELHEMMRQQAAALNMGLDEWFDTHVTLEVGQEDEDGNVLEWKSCTDE